MPHLLTMTNIPAPVLQLMNAAVAGHLLLDVDTMAGHLQTAGWVRQTHGGAWALPAATAWSVQSLDHDPSLSIFASGSDELIAQAADHLKALLDAGEAGALEPGEPDTHCTHWRTDDVGVRLYVTTGRPIGRHWVDADVHLALERSDAPPEGRPHDPARDRRIARDGTPVARWYLAGHDRLTDDVVDLLARDDDPAVVAALAAGEQQRRFTSEHLDGP